MKEELAKHLDTRTARKLLKVIASSDEKAENEIALRQMRRRGKTEINPKFYLSVANGEIQVAREMFSEDCQALEDETAFTAAELREWICKNTESITELLNAEDLVSAYKTFLSEKEVPHHFCWYACNLEGWVKAYETETEAKADPKAMVVLSPREAGRLVQETYSYTGAKGTLLKTRTILGWNKETQTTFTKDKNTQRWRASGQTPLSKETPHFQIPDGELPNFIADIQTALQAEEAEHYRWLHTKADKPVYTCLLIRAGKASLKWKWWVIQEESPAEVRRIAGRDQNLIEYNLGRIDFCETRKELLELLTQAKNRLITTSPAERVLA